MKTYYSKEELLLYQKARTDWLNFGDKNSRFFNASIIIRRKKNRVEYFENDSGTWISNETWLEEMTVNF